MALADRQRMAVERKIRYGHRTVELRGRGEPAGRTESGSEEETCGAETGSERERGQANRATMLLKVVTASAKVWWREDEMGARR